MDRKILATVKTQEMTMKCDFFTRETTGSQKYSPQFKIKMLAWLEHFIIVRCPCTLTKLFMYS